MGPEILPIKLIGTHHNSLAPRRYNSPCLSGILILKSNSKRGVSEDMCLFPNEDILTTEIESWISFVDSLSSKEEDRELFQKYAK